MNYNVQQWAEESNGVRGSVVVIGGDQFVAGIGLTIPAGKSKAELIDDEDIKGFILSTGCRECAAEVIDMLNQMVEQLEALI